MKRFWPYVRQHRWLLIGTLCLATLSQVASLVDPQIFRLIIDRYATQAGSLSAAEFVRGVGGLLALSVAIVMVARIAFNMQQYWVSVISQRIGASLYARAVASALALPYAKFEDQRSGELLQKLQKARTDTQLAITGFINTIFVAAVGTVFVVVYAATLSWVLGLVVFSIVPVIGTVVFTLSKRIKAAQAKVVAQSADLAGSTTETLRNVELVKSLGLEGQEERRLSSVNDRVLKLELEKTKLTRKLFFIQGTTINAVRTAMLLMMMLSIFRGSLTLGQFFSLYFYLFYIINPLGELGNVAASFNEARASQEQVDEIFKTPAEPRVENPVTVGKLERIQFSHVTFSYGRPEQASLDDVNIELARGQTVAFVGPSGAGKTTLVKLLVGLYRPTSGELLINGVNSRNVDYAALRERIGLVAQDTQLFAGTIRDNLTFVKPSATDGECLAALRAAAAMPIVERGQDGLSTKVGEGGLKLSGGERQRLAIARALLRNPDLVIFDEATSSLDSLTERSITETVRSVARERNDLMTVIVAHRLSTVAHATVIYVLERGRVSEVGTHDQLLANRGLYAALWREQSGSRA